MFGAGWFLVLPDIPVGRNRFTFTNKQLVQRAELVSSGEVLEPEGYKAVEP
jgi:hypothetical protein